MKALVKHLAKLAAEEFVKAVATALGTKAVNAACPKKAEK